MTETRDTSAIRAVLSKEPNWSVYALGDLVPGYFEHSAWYTEAGSLVLLYRAVTPPVLFAMGEPQAIRGIADGISDPLVYLHVRPETVEALRTRYRPLEAKPMLRMVLDPEAFRPESGTRVARLGKRDVPDLERLYADGQKAGEAPDFFFPSMVDAGVFFGVWEGEALIAVAGTHLAARSEGVGAIGNVYTRRDRRGRGLAGRLTSAVAGELLAMGVRTVALNVSRKNAAAIRVYERLGFFRYCEFVEGVAERV